MAVIEDEVGGWPGAKRGALPLALLSGIAVCFHEVRSRMSHSVGADLKHFAESVVCLIALVQKFMQVDAMR